MQLRWLGGLGLGLVLWGCGASAEPEAAEMEVAAPVASAQPAGAVAAAGGGSSANVTKPSMPAAGGGAAPSAPASPTGAAGKPAAGAGGTPATTSPDAPASAGTAAPVAGAAGGSAGASAAAAGSAGAAPSEHEDLGEGDGSDVVTIGDSWMSFFANGGGIEAGLRTASMQPYRNYGVAGTMLLDEVIPNQYAAAKRENPDIKTVVMTGGGNDLLLTGMSGGTGCSESCMSTIDKVAARLESLWKEMGDDGVQDLVYIEYSEGGDNGASVAYGHTKLVPLCAAAAPIRCHLLHSDDFIMMMLLDGVHPTADGCSKLGTATFDLMEQEGMRR